MLESQHRPAALPEYQFWQMSKQAEVHLANVEQADIAFNGP